MKVTIISGLLAILSIQHAQAITIENCIKLAISKGVPELGIPSHDPLVIPNSFSFGLDNFLGASLNFTVSKFTWTNIPDYRITKNTVTKDTASVRDIVGEILWENFTISFDYVLTFTDQKFQGNIEYRFKNVSWSGSWEETKPDNDGIRQINSLVIKQTKAIKTVKTTGFGFTTVIAENLLLALYDIFAELHINQFNLLGKGFAAKINKFWYGNPTTFNTLVQWCDSQES